MPLRCFIMQAFVLLRHENKVSEVGVHTARESFSEWCRIAPLCAKFKRFFAAVVRSSGKCNWLLSSSAGAGGSF